MTKVEPVAIDIHRPDLTVIGRVAGLLLRGGLVAAPTETRYGILARADSEAVLGKLYRAKRRLAVSPTALFVRDYASFRALGETNLITDRLIDAFLPGPLTLVTRAIAQLPDAVAPGGKVGLRISSSPVIASILAAVDFPLTATSANISGQAESETITEIIASFGESVDLYLDGGPLTGLVSTVVDCTGITARVLRAGAIPEESIRRVLDRVS